MPNARVVQVQRDFSGGEADSSIKRGDDHPQLKSVARQASNWRPLASRALANRPGRRIIGIEGPRVDEVVMSPGNTFYLVFGNGYLHVYNAAFTKVFGSGPVVPWTTTTAKTVVWDYYKYSVYICFDGMQPRVLTWDGVSQTSTWTLSTYTVRVMASGAVRNVFYRLNNPGGLLLPSANSGNISIGFNNAILQAGYVGTYMRYCNRQFKITGFSTTVDGTATVIESLPYSQSMTFPSDPSLTFAVGDEIIGKTSGAKGLITSITPATDTLVAQLLQSNFAASSGSASSGVVAGFQAGETVVGPSGSATISTLVSTNTPQSVTIWDEEVMNSFHGWPRSCTVDQGRLIFCDFPALPQLIVWSAVGNFDDLYTDANNANATNAIQEIVPGKSRVLYVVPGADGSEFVFCDNAVYYIPISESNPLKPGSVAFKTLMTEGAAQVQPRPVQQSIVYFSAGLTEMKAVQAIGAYNRPYIVDDISELHSHLLNSPICIAAPGGSDQFEENYFYIANTDGSLVLVNFKIKSGIIDVASMGYLPWSGNGTATWISALKGHSDVLICALYAPGSATGANVVEQMDATQYLDATMVYNNAPASLVPPAPGQGPLWYLANGTVDLMNGTRMLGTYHVDSNGFLVPQNNAGEDLTNPNFVVGQAWNAIIEPFVPAVQGGQDAGQRMWPRRVCRYQVYVQNSTGFTVCRLFSGPSTRTSPAIGTVMSRRRIEAWNQDDDPTVAPPLREQSYIFRPIGRAHDPRIAIIKDTPGPLTILEIDLEVTV